MSPPSFVSFVIKLMQHWNENLDLIAKAAKAADAASAVSAASVDSAANAANAAISTTN